MPVTSAAAKSRLPSVTRAASGSPRRSRRASRAASATIAADSQRSPRAATPPGSPRAVGDQPVGPIEQPVEHPAQAGLAAGAVSASTPIPAAARSSSGR